MCPRSLSVSSGMYMCLHTALPLNYRSSTPPPPHPPPPPSQISDLRARRAAGELSPTADQAGSVTGTYASGGATSGDIARALHMTGGAGAPAGGSSDSGEKDAAIAELRETVEIMELKVRKLEQLVKLKDQRIAALTARLAAPDGGSA